MPPQAAAQKRQVAGTSDFAGSMARWQQATDPEQRIELGEQLLAREPSVRSWPLQETRERVKAELRFGVGSAYVARLRGVRADNLEKGIAHLEAALPIWTREADPENWGRVNNNLGIAYWARVRGARADNQEKSIAHFEAALALFSREAAPREWAQLQNNLAIVYFNRVHGARAANVETAIAHFEAALGVFTRETDPNLWAQIQNNLGSTYGARVEGDRADNKEKAVAYLEAALTVLTRDTSPLEWGSAQSNLGSAYLNRTRGEVADNQHRAISHVETALTIFTHQDYPQQWAKAQTILGNAFADRAGADRPGNRAKSVAAYEAALSVFTRDAFPQDHLFAAQRLGRVLLEGGEWRKAGTVHASARDAFLVLFGQGLDEVEARALITAVGPLFAEAAFGALQRGETEAGFELAGEGRARLMAVALKLQTLELPAAKRKRLADLRAAIRATQLAVDAAQGTERAAAIEKLVALRQELLGLVKSATPGNDGGTTALAVARRLAATGAAVAMPVVTKFGGKILIVAKSGRGKDLTVLNMPELNIDRLVRLLIGPDGGPPAGWLAKYFINYLDPEEIDKRWPEWLAAIDDLGPELWGMVGARLDAALKERGVKPGTRLVWLPSGWLGTLPLGLAQDPASKRHLADGYEIVYAPSLEALDVASRRAAAATKPSLAVVINPTGDLPGTEKEGAIVASHFPASARTLLKGEAATPDAVLAALKGRTHWHFASHGTFSWSDPRQSALVMYDLARLSVGRLLETEGLGQPRLVVLSACETGLFEITSNPDEFMGLPGAFTALGAAGVLGTLWPVSDAATALLMAKFYELHMDGRLSPPSALNRAQSWLRQATNTDLEAYAKAAAARGRLDSRQLGEIARDLSAEGLARSRNKSVVQWVGPGDKPSSADAQTPSPEQFARPYAHPYFWAGFVLTGL
jgi:CHAT domain-containing protein/tetratricopeptide (TPR) repeat protein